MRLVKTPGGRTIGLLDAGERTPADAPRQTLRKRGDFWYQVKPHEDSQPRDPKTGDHIPRGSHKAKMTKLGAKSTDRRERLNTAGASSRRQKAIREISGKRTQRRAS